MKSNLVLAEPSHGLMCVTCRPILYCPEGRQLLGHEESDEMASLSPLSLDDASLTAGDNIVHDIMTGVGAAGVVGSAGVGAYTMLPKSTLPNPTAGPNYEMTDPWGLVGPIDREESAAELEGVEWLAKSLGEVLYGIGNIPARMMQGSEQLRTEGMDPRQVTDDPRAQTFDPSGFGDAIMLAAGGGPQAAERGAVGVFGGRVAADNLAKQGILVPKQAIARAQQMAADGASKEAIYSVTSKMMADARLPYGGVHRDKAGNLLFEIPDEGLKVTEGGWTKLGNKVQHPELQKAYPRETRSEALAIKTRPGSPFAGQFDERWQNLLSGRLNPAQIEANALTMDDLREVLAHEFDHFAGSIEGRPTGTNPQAAMQQIEKAKPELDPAMRELLGHDMYNRATGEVYARNAEKRLRMTPEMRQKYPPWLTEDVPPEQQLIIPQGHPYPQDAKRPALGQGAQPLHPEDQLSTERLITPMSPKVAESAELIKWSKAFRERGNNEMADLYQAAARAKAIEGGFEGDPLQWAWPGAKE